MAATLATSIVCRRPAPAAAITCTATSADAAAHAAGDVAVLPASAPLPSRLLPPALLRSATAVVPAVELVPVPVPVPVLELELELGSESARALREAAARALA